MKRILLSAIVSMTLALSSVTSVMAQDAINIPVKKDQNISAVVTKPVGFVEGSKCPIVILMHDLKGNKEDANLRQVASQLQQQGVATLLFDFSAHGNSNGVFKDITVKNELKEIDLVYEYAKKLPFVKGIAFVGYSYGGTLALLAASDLGKGKVKALGLLAPLTSIREDALRGSLFGKSFDPNDVPRSLDLDETRSLSRDFVEDLQQRNILKAASEYKGETLILQGKKDNTVPVSYGEYLQMLMPNAKFELLKDLDHNFFSEDIEKHNKAIGQLVEFIVKQVK